LKRYPAVRNAFEQTKLKSTYYSSIADRTCILNIIFKWISKA